MADFLLIHGAWHGGWCWDRVVPLLEGAGHKTHAPTLSGLEEDRTEPVDGIGIETHVEDVLDAASRLATNSYWSVTATADSRSPVQPTG